MSRRRIVLSIIAGMLVAIPLPLLSFGVSKGSCPLGTEVAAYNYTLTPWIISDSPLYGKASLSVITHNGSSSTNSTLRIAENGTVGGWFEIENWTIYLGASQAGRLGPCTQPFIAVVHDNGNAEVKQNPPGLNEPFSNDSQAPTYIGANGTDTAVIYYYAGFYHQTGTISTCGKSTETFWTRYGQTPIGLGFEYGGSWHILNESMPNDLANSYTFPADGGTWAVDNLSAPGGPGGGWSFSYLGGCAA